MSNQSSPRKAPGPGLGSIPGILWSFPRKPVTFCRDLTRKYGDTVAFRIGPYLVHLVVHPDAVKHVLNDNHKNYTKGQMVEALKAAIGSGLVTSEGEEWRRQRRLANPTFRHEKLCSFIPLFAERTRKLLDEWEASMAKNETRDIEQEMKRLTFGIGGHAFFSTEMEQDAPEVGAAIQVLLAEGSKRAAAMMPLPLWVPTPSNRRLNHAVRVVDDYLYGLIRERRKSTSRPFDLMTSMMEAVDEETNETMTDQQVRDQMVGFVADGYGPTALALAWALYLVAEHPEAGDKVRAEYHQVVGDRSPVPDDLERLQYTRMVVEEALRLYPPVPFLARSPSVADQIGGYNIPARSLVLLSPFLTHRHDIFWENPEQFNPDRFTDEAVRDRHHQAYFPFGSGQRKCIGVGFSMMEATVILGMIVISAETSIIGPCRGPGRTGATAQGRHTDAI